MPADRINTTADDGLNKRDTWYNRIFKYRSSCNTLLKLPDHEICNLPSSNVEVYKTWILLLSGILIRHSTSSHDHGSKVIFAHASCTHIPYSPVCVRRTSEARKNRMCCTHRKSVDGKIWTNSLISRSEPVLGQYPDEAVPRRRSAKA